MWMRGCAPAPSHKPESSKSTHVVVSPSCGCRCFPFFLLSLPPSFVVPTHVASAPFLSEAFGKIEYADDRDRGRRGSSGGGAKANAEASSPLPPPAMQTKFGATGKSY